MNTENRDDSSGTSEPQINEIVYQVLLQSRERIYNRAKEILADNHALREENEDLERALARSEYRIQDMAEDIERLRAELEVANASVSYQRQRAVKAEQREQAIAAALGRLRQRLAEASKNIAKP